MQVIRKDPGKPPRLVEIPNTLKALQQAVGGYIEVWNMDPCGRSMAVCRANGAEQGLPVNCRIPYLGCVLYGTVCVLRRDYKENQRREAVWLRIYHAGQRPRKPRPADRSHGSRAHSGHTGN